MARSLSGATREGGRNLGPLRTTRRSPVPAESASSRPFRSMMITRPPRSHREYPATPELALRPNLPAALSATSCAAELPPFTSASTRRDRFSASGSSSATITSTSTYAKAEQAPTQSHAPTQLVRVRRSGSRRRGRCDSGVRRIVAELLAQPGEWTSSVFVEPNQFTSHTSSISARA